MTGIRHVPGLSHFPVAACWGLALSWLFILYETTIPFHFQFSSVQLAAGWDQAVLAPLRGPGGVISSRSDLLGNIPLFIPLGFFLALAPMFSRTGAWRPWLLCLAGLGTSLTVESLQIFSPLRYTQTTDLITNTGGTVVGVSMALAGGNRLFDRACRWCLQQLRGDPSALILVILTVVILLGSLLPLDFNISQRSMALQWQTAHLDPFSLPAEGWLVASLGFIKQAWLFAFWGAAAAHVGAGRRRLLLQILAWAALLALLAEGSHLFVKSRHLSSLSWLLNWLGAGCGAVAYLLGQKLGLSTRHLVTALGVGYLIYLVADCVSPLAVSVMRSLLATVSVAGAVKSGPIPLLPPDPMPTLMALGDNLARLTRFVPLGLMVRLVVPRTSLGLAFMVIAALVVLILELLVWYHSPWSGNLTEVTLAWLGMALGWWGGTWIARERAPVEPCEEISS